MKNPSIVGVLCTDSQGLNLGCKYITSSLLVDCIALDVDWEPAAKSLQSCPTLCNPIDGSPPGSLVPGIFQARTLEWVAISFSNAWKWKVKGKSLSCVRLLATPWTAAYQAPLSMGFSRQEYWSGVPLPSPDWEPSMLLFSSFYFLLSGHFLGTFMRVDIISK